MKVGNKKRIAVGVFVLAMSMIVWVWINFGPKMDINNMFRVGSLIVVTDKQSYGLNKSEVVEIKVTNKTNQVARIWFSSSKIQKYDEVNGNWVEVKNAVDWCPCGALCGVPPFWKEVGVGEELVYEVWDKMEHVCRGGSAGYGEGEVIRGRFRVKMEVSYGKFRFLDGVVDRNGNMRVKSYEVYSPEFEVK